MVCLSGTVRPSQPAVPSPLCGALKGKSVLIAYWDAGGIDTARATCEGRLRASSPGSRFLLGAHSAAFSVQLRPLLLFKLRPNSVRVYFSLSLCVCRVAKVEHVVVASQGFRSSPLSTSLAI